VHVKESTVADPFFERMKRSPPYRLARFLYRFTTDFEYRSAALIRFEKPPNLFQPYLDTWLDRYPLLFAFAQEKLGAHSEVRVLSFGCSTGEEVFSLRCYLRSATIKGIDVNRRAIARCRAKLGASPDSKITFEVASSTSDEKSQFYDAIFCLAVMRHGDLGARSTSCSGTILPFAAFERQVHDFARCLKVGGFLFLAHSNFRFCDTDTARCFEVALSLVSPAAQTRTPLFGRDNLRLADQAYGDLVFRKVAHPQDQ